MSELRELHENLQFVRGAVSRARVNVGSPSIYFLWAAITGIGFSLPAIAPGMATRYWIAAVIGGGILSIRLGQRHARAIGVMDRDFARRQGMHWLATGVAMAGIVAGVAADRLQWAVALPLLVSFAGLSYLLAGIHLYPPLRWAGAIFLAGGVALWWVPGRHLGVVTGIAIAIALGVAGFIARRSMREA